MNSSTIYLSVASLCYIIMIMIVNFSKEQVNTSENKVFSKLLIVSFCSLLSEIYIAIMPTNINFFPFVLSLKLYLVLCIYWLSYFMEYVFIITRNNERKPLINYKKEYKKQYLIFWTLTSIFSLIVALLPIHFFNSYGMKYSYGTGVNLVFALSGLYVFIMSIYIIKNIKYIKNNGYLPIIFLVILLSITGIIQKSNPSLLLANTCFALITSLMYHTIENPDIKMAKDLAYSKKVAELSQRKTLEALNSISQKLKDPIDKLLIFGYKKIDKNDKEKLTKELKSIQKNSIKLASEISGLIELAKLDSGELLLKEDKYDVMEMLNSIKELFLYAKGNKKITITTNISNNISSILYGDSNIIKQTILYLYSYIINIIKTGNIEVKIDNIKVGVFSRLKFHFIIDNNKIREYAREDKSSKILTLTGNYDNITYITMKKLLKLTNSKLEVRYNDINHPEIILSINQRIISPYEALDQKEENKNIKVKYFNASHKRIIALDDNHSKIKELLLLLKPYQVQLDIASNYNELRELILSDKTYDLVLIDDLLPNNNLDDITNKLNEIKTLANYEIRIIMMVTSEENNIIKKYIDAGIDDYLVKPLNKQKINKLLTKFFK